MYKKYLIIVVISIVMIIIVGIWLGNLVKKTPNTNTNKQINKYLDDLIVSDNNDNSTKVLNNDINVNFTDNIILAIGLLDENEEEFVNKYFNNRTYYKNLKLYDFRSDYTVAGNKFIIIPKNSDVKAIVYACSMDENGKIILKNSLISLNHTGPYIIKKNYIEYIPDMCIKIEYNGFEEIIPLTFSGENGHIDLKGFESEVLDISIYKN